jgi:PAS domain S-box-containing protein
MKTIQAVLLVEDDCADAVLLREMLLAQGLDTALTHVTCLRDAELHLSERSVDAILLDLSLPDAQGLEAVRRAHHAAPHTPLVVLTGLDDESMAAQVLQEGAQDYLIKGQIETRGLTRALRYAIERKRSELALGESAHRFRAIFSAVSEGIFIVDAATGTFAEVNEPGATMYGYARDEMIGLNIQSISSDVAPYTQGDAMRWIEKAAATGEPQRFDWHCKAKDGRLFWGEIAIRFAFISGRQVVLSLVRDVTDRRAIEDQLRQAQKMEAIGQLTGGIAHDFNNLLTVILSNAESLAEELGGSPDLRALAEMTRTAAERGAELTNSLLTFARRQALEPQSVDINKLVAGMDGLLRRTLDEEIDIKIIPGFELWKATVDPVQLESALLNLALNARDAMPNGGKLTIETSNADIDVSYGENSEEAAPGRYVLLCVSDTGTGMSKDVAAKAFDPFFSTKEVGKGTGLGLSMVYGFVKQSGGHIKIYSEMGLGTSFRIYLPLSTDVELPKIVAATRGGDPIGMETILAVEDDDLVRANTERVLRSLGYKLLIASNGPAALAILERGDNIDLLFTDVVMPGGMGGRQLAEEACAMRPSLKVLFTSGYTDNALIHHGRLDPGVHLIRKPYRKKDLAIKLRQLLDTNGSSARRNVSSGSIS